MNGIWIRSQDRETLLFASYVDYQSEDSAEPIITRHSIVSSTIFGYFDELAVYESKERALEVLDEIAQFIDGYQKFEHSLEGRPISEWTEGEINRNFDAKRIDSELFHQKKTEENRQLLQIAPSWALTKEQMVRVKNEAEIGIEAQRQDALKMLRENRYYYMRQDESRKVFQMPIK